MKIEKNAFSKKTMYVPIKSTFGGRKPVKISGITSIKFENYNLDEVKKRIEEKTGKPADWFDTNSGDKQPQNMVLFNGTQRITIDKGTAFRDDVNNTLQKCMITEGGKTFYNISGFSHDGTVSEFIPGVVSASVETEDDDE